ncbi:hypothetical protein ACFVKB_41310 [Rhodococcus sp. NPDC127530]|uniref:hypothetical protein n=1 Tax=unclassified Rhodococcus (in: high G+C Gram-positive bacteria) TaxID=192944 RepID=UPI00363735E6
MKLSSLPDRRAEHDPHGPAVSDARLRLTSAQLSDRVQSSSHPLGELRIGSVDLVALRPITERVFPFVATLDALAYVESGRAKGKVAVTMNDAGDLP